MNINFGSININFGNKKKTKKVEDPGRYLWPSNLTESELRERKKAMVKRHPEWSKEQVKLFWELNS